MIMQLVKCLECDKEFQLLIKHIICKHNMSIEQYKMKYPDAKFDTEEMRIKRWNSTKKSIQKKYGVDNIMHVESIKDKAEKNMRDVIQQKYGVSHLMKSEFVKKNYQDALMKKYGKKCVMQVKEIQQKQRKSYSKTCMKKYGKNDTFSVIEIQMKARTNAIIKPNGIESLLIKEFPELIYVGDGKTWIQFRDTTRKNPDFIMKDSNKVVEIFGDYWHSKIKTGLDKEIHQKDIINRYQQVGYSCLIIWENEIKNDFENVKIKISNFIRNCSPETTRRTPQNIVDEDIVQTVWKHTELDRNVQPPIKN